MDLFDRRIARRLERDLGLADGEVVDFEIGTSRPLVALPRQFAATEAEQARIEVVLTEAAMHLRVMSRTNKGAAVALPWRRVAWFGPHKADGRWKRWSLRGELTGPAEPLAVSLGGRPRPSFVGALTDLGVSPEPR